jgi:hypothetical protein
MYSTTESVESPLDVVVHFSDGEWGRARKDLGWAVSMVIVELKKHKARPEEYFATKPSWACWVLPWGARIKLEVMGHIWTNDRDIRFSEWWIVKVFR